jgi:hypothetical protein
LLVLAVALVLPAAGCAAQDAPTVGATVETSTSSPADRPTPAADSGTSGRLATVSIADWSGFPDAGRLDATFRLGAPCTTLHGPPREPVLLVWPDDPRLDRPGTTRHRSPEGASHRSIGRDHRRQLVNPGGTPVTGVKKYVMPPHESCPTDSFFLVTQIY